MTEPTAHHAIRTALLAGHAVVRAGLASLLADRETVTVVGAAASAADALALLTAQRPDVVVLDPDSDLVTLQAMTELTGGGVPRVIVFTAQSDWRIHRRAFELGVVGLVMKTDPVETLVRAIERVHLGEVWLDPLETAGLLSRLLRQPDPDAAKIAMLTRRERQIVDLVGQGLRNSLIGERLFISGATVRNHLTSILRKLDLSNRFELAVYSFRHGLVQADGHQSHAVEAVDAPAAPSPSPGRAGRR